MDHEPRDETDSASHLPRDDEENRIVAALDHRGGSIGGDGETYGQADTARQKSGREERAEGLGRLLDFADFADRLARGGQEHDVFVEDDRYFKLTREGVFGLAPGIDLALVPFDVIPVQPDGGFLDFIHLSLEAGGSLQVVRTAHTTTRAIT